MKIKVISPQSRRAEQVAQLLSTADPTLEVLAASASPMQSLALTQAVNGSRPALVFIDAVDASALEAVSRFTHEHPHIDTLVLSAEQSPQFLLQAMQAGVREVLPASADAAALRAAVQRAARRHAPAATAQGQVLAFIGCKGGNGTSVLAANLAHRLADRGMLRVALIDLDLQSGNALLLLSDQRPGSDVAQVARNVSRLDAELLRSAMVQLSETLYVLAAPEDIAQTLDIKAEHVQAIVRQARQMFDFVVLDLGSRIDALKVQALDQATHVFPVLQLNLPQLRDARRMQSLLQSLELAPKTLCWIVNRYEKNSEVPLQALVQALNGAVVRTVPSHFASVSTAVNQGLPIARHSPVVKALDELALALAPQEPPAKEGWLSQLFKTR